MKTYWIAFEIEVPEGMDPTQVTAGPPMTSLRTSDQDADGFMASSWYCTVLRVRALWPSKPEQGVIEARLVLRERGIIEALGAEQVPVVVDPELKPREWVFGTMDGPVPYEPGPN